MYLEHRSTMYIAKLRISTERLARIRMGKDYAEKKNETDKCDDELNTTDIKEETYTPTDDNNSETEEQEHERERKTGY